MAGPTVPPIEAVAQVELPPVRPGRGWYALGGTVIVAGLVVGFLLLVSGAFGYLRDLDDLGRVDLPGRGTVSLPAGAVTVFHEPAGGGVVGPGSYDLTIEDPDGREVALVAPAAPDRYVVEGRHGVAVAQFEAPVAGRYRVEAGPGATGALAIGASPTERLSSLGRAGLAVAGAALGLGVGVLVVTWRRRVRAQAARLADQRARAAAHRSA